MLHRHRLLAVLAFLNGASFLPRARRAGFLQIFQSAPGEGSGGGGKPAGTLEEQLSTARSELATANGSVQSLTKERDGLKSERDTLQTQFNEASREATKAKGELDIAQKDLTSARSEISTLKSTAEATNKNVARLETLCGVKGINPAAAVPEAPENQNAGGEHVFDRHAKAQGAEKTTLWRAHHAEIRAEGERRQREGNR